MEKKYRITGILLAAVFIGLLSIISATACSCGFPRDMSTEEQVAASFNSSSAVFSGKVISFESTWSGKMKATFEVETIWKGEIGKKVKVTTGRGGGDCGFEFKVGEEYLVYAYGEDDLSANICSRTKGLNRADDDISFLGKPITQYEVDNVPQNPPPFPDEENIFQRLWHALLGFFRNS